MDAGARSKAWGVGLHPPLSVDLLRTSYWEGLATTAVLRVLVFYALRVIIRRRVQEH